MRKKVLFGLIVVALALIAVLLMASPPETDAQGLVFFCGDLRDHDNDGVYVYSRCIPLKKNGQVINNRGAVDRLEVCAFEYEDRDNNGRLTKNDYMIKVDCDYDFLLP